MNKTAEQLVEECLDRINAVYNFGDDEMNPDCCIGEIPQTFHDLHLHLLAIRRMVKQNG